MGQYLSNTAGLARAKPQSGNVYAVLGDLGAFARAYLTGVTRFPSKRTFERRNGSYRLRQHGTVLSFPEKFCAKRKIFREKDVTFRPAGGETQPLVGPPRNSCYLNGIAPWPTRFRQSLRATCLWKE